MPRIRQSGVIDYKSGRSGVSLADKEFIAQASPKILLIAGTSGAGKSTLANHLLNKYPDRFVKLVRSTTRPPREDDNLDEQFRFLSEDEFNSLNERGKIYFQHDRYGYHYGFYAESINLALSSGKIIIIEGWKSSKLMQKFWPHARTFSIVVLPLNAKEEMLRGQGREDSLKFLSNRISERNPKMSKAEINKRTRQTFDEIIEIQKTADAVLVNAPRTELQYLFAELDGFVEANVFPVIDK